MSRRNVDVEVSAVRQLAPRIREYLLTSVDGSAMERCEPGSHIELHTTSPVSGPIVRHYSLLGGHGLVDDPSNTYRVAVQREDRQRGSAHIHDSFAVGTRLQISVPKMNFALGRRDPNVLLIAGGIGITPIYSMLRSVVKRDAPFSMVYAGRSIADMALVDEVKELAGSRVTIHESHPAGLNGPVTHVDLKALLLAQPEGTHVYVCGPTPMVDAARATAKKLGWPADHVHSELFASGPTGNEVAFNVQLKKLGRTIHVGRDTTILDAITAAGVPALFDCRRGECGLCPMTVLEADGPIDHHDRFLSDDDKASGKTLCICVSRTRGQTLVLDA